MDAGWFRQQLDRPGKSQAGLEAAAGFPAGAVSKILSGDRKLKLEEVSRVAAYLGCAPLEVIYRTGQPWARDVLLEVRSVVVEGGFLVSVDRVSVNSPLGTVSVGLDCAAAEAVVVRDRSTAPRYKWGEHLVLQAIPLALAPEYVGADVVATLEDGRRALRVLDEANKCGVCTLAAINRDVDPLRDVTVRALSVVLWHRPASLP